MYFHKQNISLYSYSLTFYNNFAADFLQVGCLSTTKNI